MKVVEITKMGAQWLVEFEIPWVKRVWWKLWFFPERGVSTRQYLLDGTLDFPGRWYTFPACDEVYYDVELEEALREHRMRQQVLG